MSFKPQDVITGIGFLILIYLVVTNGPAVNQLLVTSTRGGVSLIRTLQGR